MDDAGEIFGDRSLIGRVLNDTYRIESQLGAGGMAGVYEASHLRMERRFAIKILLEAFSKDRDALARFAREAKVTGSLGHPNIVEVVDFFFPADGEPYLVMELLRGEDLAARLLRPPRLTLDEIDHFLYQIASALDTTHKRGIIHRDLKPSNLFICNSLIKVLDFGMSKVLRSDSALTGVEGIIGTPFYMSPEQIRGDANIDAGTDIYAIGAILFEMLTGQPPFTSASIFDVLGRALNDPPPPVSRLRRGLPPGVDVVVHQALSKKSEDRPTSVGAFARAFARAAGTAGPQRNVGLVALSDPLPPQETTPPVLKPDAQHAAQVDLKGQTAPLDIVAYEPDSKSSPTEDGETKPIELLHPTDLEIVTEEVIAPPVVISPTRRSDNLDPTKEMVGPLPVARRSRVTLILIRITAVLVIIGVGVAIGLYGGLRESGPTKEPIRPRITTAAVIEPTVAQDAASENLDSSVSPDQPSRVLPDALTVVLQTRKPRLTRRPRRLKPRRRLPRLAKSSRKVVRKNPSPARKVMVRAIVQIKGRIHYWPIKIDGKKMPSAIKQKLEVGEHVFEVDHEGYYLRMVVRVGENAQKGGVQKVVLRPREQ